jgi:NAD(P)H-nitrite reductase large subunit
MNHKKLVCVCNHVTRQEIVKVLQTGDITTADIQRITTAGTGCGRCVREIDAMVKKQQDVWAKRAQLRLKF